MSHRMGWGGVGFFSRRSCSADLSRPEPTGYPIRRADGPSADQDVPTGPSADVLTGTQSRWTQDPEPTDPGPRADQDVPTGPRTQSRPGCADRTQDPEPTRTCRQDPGEPTQDPGPRRTGRERARVWDREQRSEAGWAKAGIESRFEAEGPGMGQMAKD
jgi:hypothetical protein